MFETAVFNLHALQNQISANAKLVVGVSGGADSVALLHFLHQRLPAEQLIVAHLNHGLRETAVSHANFVQTIAAFSQLAHYEKTVNVAHHGCLTKQSIEAAGRQLRYQFLAEVAAETNAEAILTAHHANDQAETVLLHLLRGSGLDGLRGMQQLVPLPSAPHLWHARPFLSVPQSDIIAYCQENQLTWVEDETNNDLRFLRNRLRHSLLPELASYNPNIVERLNTLTELVDSDVALLEQQTNEQWTAVCEEMEAGVVILKRLTWHEQPLALRRRLLRKAIVHCQLKAADISFSVTEAARRHMESGRTGSMLQLPGKVTLHVGYQTLAFCAHQASLPMADVPQLENPDQRPLRVGAQCGLANGWRLAATRWSEATIPADIDPLEAFVDVADKTLTIRPRIKGERIQPFGLNGRSTSLKKMMINRKIPAALRARWPMVATDDHPVWLVGQQLDQRSAVTPSSGRIIHLRCLPPSHPC